VTGGVIEQGQVKTMASTADGAGKFDLGRVFSRTFSALGNNLPVYLGLSLLLTGLPTLLVALSVPGLVGRNPFAASPLPILGPAYFIGLLVSVIGAFLLQAALIRATIDDLGGRKVDFAECLMTALRNFLPILGIAIVSSFAIGIGFVFLIVPGIIIGLMWSVSVPSQIEEKRGVFGSLSRSRELTKGSRWALLGLVVVIYIVAAVIAALVGVLAVAFGPTIVAVVNALAGSISSAIFSTAIAAAYVELRTAKEGASTAGLAEIFA